MSIFGKKVSRSTPAGVLEKYADQVISELDVNIKDMKETIALSIENYVHEQEAKLRVERAKIMTEELAPRHAEVVQEFQVFKHTMRDLLDLLGRQRVQIEARFVEHEADLRDFKAKVVSVQREMEAMCNSFIKLEEDIIEQGTASFVRLLLSFLKSKGVGEKHPGTVSVDEATNQCNSTERKLLLYQKIIGQLADPTVSMNLLVFHDMGTGKSCSIGLCIQSIAARCLEQFVEGTIPGILVLVQDQRNIRNYQNEITKYCQLPNFYGKVHIAYSEPKEGESTSTWSIVSSATGRIVTEVVVHKMTVQLIKSEWRKGPLHPTPSSKTWTGPWEVPRVGAVLIDEAHNLFDPSDLKTGHAPHNKLFIQQLMARPDMKKFLFTGTPGYSSTRFDNLGRLLDFLRWPLK